MTPLSTRYVRPLSFCLLVALIPVAVHSYFHLDRDDCSGTLSLVPAARSDTTHAAFLQERFDSFQLSEGGFAQDGVHFDYTIIRSYDPKRLYHRPEKSLVLHADVASRSIEWLPASSGPLPIHLAHYREEGQAIAVAYLLVFGSSPVASPYWPHLRAAPFEMFAGRRPMTLVLIQARGFPNDLHNMERVEDEWLVSWWEKYRTACLP